MCERPTTPRGASALEASSTMALNGEQNHVEDVDLTCPTLPSRPATSNSNSEMPEINTNTRVDVAVDTNQTDIPTRISPTPTSDAPGLSSSGGTPAAASSSIEVPAPPQRCVEGAEVSPVVAIPDHPPESSADGVAELVFEVLPPRRAKKRAESNIHQVVLKYSKGVASVTEKGKPGKSTKPKTTTAKSKSSAKRSVEDSDAGHTRKKSARINRTDQSQDTHDSTREQSMPTKAAADEVESSAFQQLASTGKIGQAETPSPEELQKILGWTLLDNRPRRKRKAPAYFSEKPKVVAGDRKNSAKSLPTQSVKEKAVTPSKKEPQTITKAVSPKRNSRQESAKGANCATVNTRKNPTHDPIPTPRTESSSTTTASSEKKPEHTKACADTLDVSGLKLGEIARRAEASLLEHPEEIEQWTLLGDRPKRNKSAPKSYKIESMVPRKPKTPETNCTSKQTNKPNLSIFSNRARQQRAKEETMASRNGIAATIARKMGARYSGSSLDTLIKPAANAESDHPIDLVTKPRPARTSSLSKGRKGGQASTVAQSAAGNYPADCTQKVSKAVSDPGSDDVGGSDGASGSTSLVVSLKKVADVQGDPDGSDMDKENAGSANGERALPTGEWFKGKGPDAFQKSRDMFPHLPVLEVCTVPAGQGHSSAPPRTYGEIQSPAPGFVFIRCCCCAEIFGRTNFMIHAGQAINRVNFIKLVAYDLGIGDAFGSGLQGSKAFLDEHGVVIGPDRPSISEMWKVGTCGVPVANCTVRAARKKLSEYVPNVPNVRNTVKRTPRQPERAKRSQPVKTKPSSTGPRISRRTSSEIKMAHKLIKKITCTAPRPPSTKSQSCTAKWGSKTTTAETTRDKRGDRVQVQVPEEHDVPQRVVWSTLPVPFIWGNAIQQGYEFTGNRKSRMKVWKKEAEDKVLVHHNPNHQYIAMALADGHGGANAARFFTSKILPLVEQVLERGIADGHLWDFDDAVHRRRFELLITEIYKILDKEYVTQQKERFTLWTKFQGNEEAYRVHVAGKDVLDICDEDTRPKITPDSRGTTTQGDVPGEQGIQTSSSTKTVQISSFDTGTVPARIIDLNSEDAGASHASPLTKAMESGDRGLQDNVNMVDAQSPTCESGRSPNRTSSIKEPKPHTNGNIPSPMLRNNNSDKTEMISTGAPPAPRPQGIDSGASGQTFQTNGFDHHGLSPRARSERDSPPVLSPEKSQKPPGDPRNGTLSASIDHPHNQQFSHNSQVNARHQASDGPVAKVADQVPSAVVSQSQIPTSRTSASSPIRTDCLHTQLSPRTTILDPSNQALTEEVSPDGPPSEREIQSSEITIAVDGANTQRPFYTDAKHTHQQAPQPDRSPKRDSSPPPALAISQMGRLSIQVQEQSQTSADKDGIGSEETIHMTAEDSGTQVSQPDDSVALESCSRPMSIDCHKPPAIRSTSSDYAVPPARLSPSCNTKAHENDAGQLIPTPFVKCANTDSELVKQTSEDDKEHDTTKTEVKPVPPIESDLEPRDTSPMDVDASIAALGGLDTPMTFAKIDDVPERGIAHASMDTEAQSADQSNGFQRSKKEVIGSITADMPNDQNSGFRAEITTASQQPNEAEDVQKIIEKDKSVEQAEQPLDIDTHVPATVNNQAPSRTEIDLSGNLNPGPIDVDETVDCGHDILAQASDQPECAESPCSLNLDAITITEGDKVAGEGSPQAKVAKLAVSKHAGVDHEVGTGNIIDLTSLGSPSPEAPSHNSDLLVSRGSGKSPIIELEKDEDQPSRVHETPSRGNEAQTPECTADGLELAEASRFDGQSCEGLELPMKSKRDRPLEVFPSERLGKDPQIICNSNHSLPSEGLEVSQSSRLAPATSGVVHTSSNPQAPQSRATPDEALWVSEYLQRCREIVVSDVQVLVHMNDDADKSTPLPYKASAEADARDGAEDETETGFPKCCPHDDGCTLAVNVIYRGYIVNCNVGDSRSIVISRPLEQFKWSTVFASDDQDLSRGDILTPILQAGGMLVDDITGREKPIKPGQSIYHGTGGCRIKPRAGLCDNDIGVPTRRGLNLGGTMGDLLFKLNGDNPMMRSVPDVSFVKLPNTEEEKAVLLMMSDGLVNFLPGSRMKRMEQNDYIRDQLGYKMDIGMPLQKICQQLTDREELDRSEFDDCAVFALSIERWETSEEAGADVDVAE